MGDKEQEKEAHDRPQVFMMPVNRELWLDHFKRTVDQPFEFGHEEDRPEPLNRFESTRIWGTRTGQRNEKMWSALSPGDIMMFYCEGWFFSAGRIDETLRSSEAGDYIWDSEESQFIYTLTDYQRIAIPRLEVWEWFDYSENFTRRGLSRVYPDRVESFRSEVGDIWANISKFAVDATIGEILDGDADVNQRQELDIQSEHSIFNHIEASTDTIAAYRFTAPPEYWLTSVATATLSFEEESEQEWERIEQGDVILFYCQHSGLAELEDAENGFIGAGIVRGRATKPSDDAWWWDEYNEGDSFPLLVAFERLYFTGDIDALVGPNPINDDTDPRDLTAHVEALTAGSLALDRAVSLCEQYSDHGLAISGTFSPFLQGDTPEMVRPKILLSAMAEELSAVPPINLHRMFVGHLSDDVLEGLYFQGDQGADLIEQISAALRAGKHIILTGPPGTGKTEIARRTCDYLTKEYPYLYSGFQLTTATADWSTFDTVGGYMPEETSDDGGLSFSPGIVLNRLKSPTTGIQSNEPIIIDELNRADIDKSFGQLFTLLSGQSVQLPYTIDDTEVELCNAADVEGLPAQNQFVVPNSWRIFATMNTYDKTSLYEMSYAFMRRFAFIRVSAPELRGEVQDVEDLILEYIDTWDDVERDRDVATEVGLVWQATNNAVEGRAIGPAIVKDMLGYIMAHESTSLQERLTEAVISFIFPQLEGVPKRKQILKSIAEVPRIDKEKLDEAARDMLQESIFERNE